MTMTTPSRCHTRMLAATLAAAALSGCASLSPDAGFAPVQRAAKDRLGTDLQWSRSTADQDAIDRRVAELLKQPLSADDAVQLALLNNRGLQATFQELGIADADRVQAGRLPNPSLTLGRLRQGGEVEIDRSLQFNLLRLLTLPAAQRHEAGRMAQTRMAVTAQVLALAAETRNAYIQALATEEIARYAVQVQAAAEAGADLARRQAQAGNWNKLQQAREQGFYADAALGLARAEQARGAAREQLTRLLGLWGASAEFQLPERLPDLPKQAKDLPDVEQTAMAQRMDVQAAKLGAEQLASSLGLTRAIRFINVLEVGATRNGFNDLPVQRGFSVTLELPIFDWGTARVARAEALYLQAVHRTAQAAIEARSEVRQAYAGYRSSYEIARHYRDEIVPLKKRISDENLLRYNGMLIGVFELLADARSQIASVQGYIAALRDFWLAQADLDMALIGKPTFAPPAMSGMAAGQTEP